MFPAPSTTTTRGSGFDPGTEKVCVEPPGAIFVTLSEVKLVT